MRDGEGGQSEAMMASEKRKEQRKGSVRTKDWGLTN